MERLFFKGFSESPLSDGRRLLNIELEDRERGEIYIWTPKWAEHVAELSKRALEIELANQEDGPYEETLTEAKETAVHVVVLRATVKLEQALQWLKNVR